MMTLGSMATSRFSHRKQALDISMRNAATVSTPLVFEICADCRARE